MPFKLENQMIPIIKSNIDSFIHETFSETMAIAQELPVNYRIVDLAFASINQECIGIVDNPMFKKAFNKLNMMELDVLSIFFLSNKEVSIQKLTKLLKMEAEKVKRLYLNKFIELGLIGKVTRYSYAPNEWANIHPVCVIAIEAKLKKWQEALNQAKDNLKFADYSYVALDEQNNFKPDLVDRFIESNIGLISVSESGIVNVLHKPKKNKHYVVSDFRLQRLRLCRDLICRNSKWSLVCNRLNSLGG